MSLLPSESLRPESLPQLAEVLQGAPSLRIYGSNREGREVAEHASITTTGLTGIVDFSPADQVVAVRAGTDLRVLQDELGGHSQCIPFGLWRHGKLELAVDGTVGGLISSNVEGGSPDVLGTWRDWVLGMTVVLADGRIAKSGSHAVKNVAGYDVHRLFIGSRGTLAVIGEIVLRTFPLRSLPQHPGILNRREAVGDGNSQPDATQVRFMKRTKEIFDPAHKLNPGEMGIF